MHGFRILVQRYYNHLLGLHICLDCSHRTHMEDRDQHQDWFGNNGTNESGVLGRCDASYTSIEVQKSTGAFHAHPQFFIQFLQQHESLAEEYVTAMLLENVCF